MTTLFDDPEMMFLAILLGRLPNLFRRTSPACWWRHADSIVVLELLVTTRAYNDGVLGCVTREALPWRRWRDVGWLWRRCTLVIVVAIAAVVQYWHIVAQRVQRVSAAQVVCRKVAEAASVPMDEAEVVGVGVGVVRANNSRHT
jgi:hypothetical protein